METKKLILMIIIAVVAFGLFMGYALKKIQTIERSYTYLEEPLTDEVLLDVTNKLNLYKDEILVGEEPIGSIRVLLINHLTEKAVLWNDEVKAVVDYKSLGEAERHCNYYMVYNDDEPTIIVNSDPILGDTFERVVSLAYQQRYTDISRLNPETISYFQSYNEDPWERYLRHYMILSLMDNLDERNNLEEFGRYYREWVEAVGESHLAITEYDYYDGLEAFIKVKLRQIEDPNYSPVDYIESLQNDYGLISKSREYEAIGLLWWVVAENKGLPILELDDVRTDKYKLLLEGVAYGPRDDNESYEDFRTIYDDYNKELEDMINEAKSFTSTKEPITRSLISEVYQDTLLVDENIYLYLDYVARDDDKTIIREELILVEMSPYSIEYYQ